WAIGDTSATGTGNTFVTFEGSNLSGVGIRPLAVSEYATAIPTAANTSTLSTANVRLNAPGAVNSPATVNSLILNSASAGGTVGGSGILTLTAGAVLATGGGAAADSISVNLLDVGANGGYFFANDNLGVSSTVLGTNGLTKAGAGTLVLSGPTAISGPYSVA